MTAARAKPRRPLLLDTGPLVALLNADDRDHVRCRKWLQANHASLVTTEAVLTEATHLLARSPAAQRAALTFVTSGAADIHCLSRGALLRCHALMERYEDIPMDFADATLLRVADELDAREIATLDRRGFGSYRRENGRALRMVLD